MTKEEEIDKDVKDTIRIAENIVRDIEGGGDLDQLINLWVCSATLQGPRARFRMMSLALMIGARLSEDRRLELADKIIVTAITFDFEECQRELAEIEELAAFGSPDVAEGA